MRRCVKHGCRMDAIPRGVRYCSKHLDCQMAASMILLLWIDESTIGEKNCVPRTQDPRWAEREWSQGGR